jgi:hypothetical protein
MELSGLYSNSVYLWSYVKQLEQKIPYLLVYHKTLIFGMKNLKIKYSHKTRLEIKRI